MFDYIEPPVDEKEPTDYTGPIVVAILAPVFFVFVYLGKAEMGFTVCLVLGAVILAVKIRWKLRRYIWFWAAIAFILLLHIPLLSLVRWPDTKIPTIFYSMPIGILDFLLISGAISLAERVFSNSSSSDDDDPVPRQNAIRMGHPPSTDAQKSPSIIDTAVRRTQKDTSSDH